MANAARKAAQSLKPMNKLKVLVVDDDRNLSKLVKLFLEKTKRYEVCEENQSANALTTAHRFAPDAILLDVDMPGKDGGEVARELASDPVLRRAPVLFLTSLVTAGEAGDARTERCGARFLSKPVNPQLLVEAVDRLIPARALC